MTAASTILTEPWQRLIPRLSWPMALGILSIFAFNLIDTFFIARLGSHALAAVSFTFPVTFAVNAITLGIGTGISSLVAQLLGRGERTNAASATSDSLMIVLCLIAVIALLGFFWVEPLFRALGAAENLLPLITQYMQIWFLAIPLLVIPMAGNAAMRGSGDTKTPSIIMLIAGVMNGVLDPLLIFGLGPFPRLEIQGAAIATAISWLFALCAALYVLARRQKLLIWQPLSFSRIHLHAQLLLRVGIPATLTNLLNPLTSALVMGLLASYGYYAVAAYGAAGRIEAILFIFVVATCSVMTPFLGQNYAAGQHQRCAQGLLGSLHYLMLLQLGIALVITVLASPIAYAFSDDDKVADALMHYLQVMPWAYAAQACMLMLLSSLNALRHATLALMLNIARVALVVSAVFAMSFLSFSVTAVFTSIALVNVVLGVVCYWLIRNRLLPDVFAD